jgi:peptidoglycan/xylan/chitin deacetylase (PgdA/CDA1 family)
MPFRRRSLWFAVLVAGALVAAVSPVLLLGPAGFPSPIITVWSQGQPHYVPIGTTFTRALAELHVRARPGDFLDVNGGVLRRGVNPGYVLLNGQRVTGDPMLVEGDVIFAEQGRSRTERTEIEVIRLHGRRPANPEASLATAPYEEVVTKGKVSGLVVSAIFRPVGKAKVPPAVALTFDDGPWPDSTEKVVEVLKRFHVEATFFVVGYLAERYPQIVRDEMAAGMSVQNHSWDHPFRTPFRDLPRKKVHDEIAKTKLYLATLGVDATLFRPPGGTYSPMVVQVAGELGTRLVLWSVDPKDWEPGATAKGIRKAVLANIEPGSIVELHDGGGNRSATLKALPGIIKGIRARGLTLVALTA